MAEQQTTTPSFIPKQQDTKKARNHIDRIRGYLNALMFIGVIVFVLGITVSVLSYLFLGYATTDLQKKQNLLAAETSRASEMSIADLNRFDSRLKAAKTLLNNHRVISPILDELEDHTLQAVQLTSAEISIGADVGEVSIVGSGEALNYLALATQSDSFSESDYFSNPIFTSFEQNEDGLISFDYTLSADSRITESIFFAQDPDERTTNTSTSEITNDEFFSDTSEALDDNSSGN